MTRGCSCRRGTWQNGFVAAVAAGRVLPGAALVAQDLVILGGEGLVAQGLVALSAAETILVPVPVLMVQLLQRQRSRARIETAVTLR